MKEMLIVIEYSFLNSHISLFISGKQYGQKKVLIFIIEILPSNNDDECVKISLSSFWTKSKYSFDVLMEWCEWWYVEWLNNLLIHRKIRYINVFNNEIMGVELNVITRKIHIGINMIDVEYLTV